MGVLRILGKMDKSFSRREIGREIVEFTLGCAWAQVGLMRVLFRVHNLHVHRLTTLEQPTKRDS